MNRKLKTLLIVLAVLTVLVAATVLLIPPIAKNYVEKHSRELIGRQVTIGKLRFNPFTGKLRVEQIALMEKDDSAVFASLGGFYTQVRLLPLLRRHIHIDALAVSRPDMGIWQDGNRFNFDDLLARLVPARDTTVDAAPSEPWRIDIDNIRLQEGHLLYTDLQRNVTWGFNDLDIDVPGLHLSGHERTDMGVVFNFSRGGSLRTSLAYDQATDSYDLNLILTGLSLDGTAAYFRQMLNVGSVEGLIWADMHIKGNTRHLLDLTTGGTAAVSRFRMEDPENRPVLQLDTMHIDLAQGNLQTMQYAIRRIYASGVSTRFEQYKNGGNNMLDLIKTPEERPIQTQVTEQSEQIVTIERENPAQARLNFTIDELDLQNGTVEIVDLAPKKPFRYHLSDIRLTSRDIDFSKPNNLTLDARLQHTGTARIRWKGSLQNLDNHDIMVMLSNIDLKDFTPYCEHFTAYPLTGGNLSFRSQNIITNRYLSGTNHLDIYQCSVDKKLKNAAPEFNIPLRLGLYVLKDRKGHVKIDLPVKGSIDAPEFSYRKIVMKALGNVLLKVVSSPFTFLIGHGDNLDHIALDPLQMALTSEQYAILDKIAQVLRDKPEMKITLTQHANWDQTLLRLAEGNLKMACYNASRPADEHLSMLDFERIQAMNLKSEEASRFADSLLAVRGIVPVANTPAAKAMALYRQTAEEQLVRIFANRDRIVMEYLNLMQNVPSESVTVQTAPVVVLQEYQGKARYAITMEAGGESVEIASGESSPANIAEQTVDTVPTTQDTTLQE